MKHTTEQELQQLLAELASAQADLEDAEATLRSATQAQQAEIDACMQRIQAERARIAELEVERRSGAPHEAAMVEQAQKTLNRRITSIKRALRNRPPEQVQLGWRGQHGKLTVRATRARVEPSVDPAILTELPWLRELRIGGDSPVFEEVNPHVLQRLVRRGDVKAEDVEKFIDNEFVTSPRVSVVWGDDSDGGSST